MNIDPTHKHLIGKTLDALAGGWSAQSTGERLAVALVLNRADWLAQMDYTIGEALDRIGLDWADAVPVVALALRKAGKV